MPDRTMSASRVRAVLSGHFPPRWGSQYVPAQLATRGQAPSCSVATQLGSALLQRQLHLLSKSETVMLALALYNPALFELKEQFLLPVLPCDHPLVGHPKARGMVLPTTVGSVFIAERLGVLSKHPRAREEGAGEADRPRWVPAPLKRDILLFLSDSQGPYCVTWDVKDKQGDHGLPGSGDWVERSSPRRIANSRVLDSIFVECMSEFRIPIVRVAKSDLDPMLAINLRRLLKVHQLPIDLGAEVHAEILSAYDEALKVGRPPNEVIDDFAHAGVKPAQSRRVLEQAIWHRRIRIDMYRWLAIDQPLNPEVRDPLKEFSSWFAR